MYRRFRVGAFKAAAFLVMGLAAGCYELIPVKATQTLTIHKNGSVQVSYAGEFTDLRGLMMEMERREGKRFEDVSPEAQEAFVNSIGSRKGVRRIEHLGGGRYRLVYEAAGKMETGLLPALIDAAAAGSWPIPGFIHLERDRSGPERWSTPDDSNKRNKEEISAMIAEPRAGGTEVARLLRQLSGTLLVRTDARVESHNADSTRRLPDGMTEYRWQINGENLFGVRFVVSLEDAGTRRSASGSHLPGGPCRWTAWDPCKGPFP